MALNILMMVSNTTTPHADETAMISLLQGRGDTITTTASTSTAPSAGTYDLILIGRTLIDAGVATGWRDVATPTVAMRDIAFPALDMATANSGSGSTFTVTNDTHEISVASGLVLGSNTIYTAGDLRGQAENVGAGAVSIGYGFAATAHVLFTYETGSAMQTVNAPARRVGFGFTTASLYTTLGQNVFLACCDWAAGALVSTQIVRPAAIQTAGNYRTHLGSTVLADLVAAVNEETQNDATYVESGANPSADVFEVELGSLLAPEAGTQTLRYSYWKDVDAGTAMNIVVELLDPVGAQVATWTHNNVPTTPQLAAQNVATQLGAGQYRVRFTATEV